MRKKRCRVLIIDEDANVRDALARLLRRHEIEVSTAVSGTRALRRVRSGEKFDCIIMDLLLPDMSGSTFVETISNESLIALSRIIILTAVHNVDNATAYLQFGCASYCGKPYENERILSQVMRACRLIPYEPRLDAII